MKKTILFITFLTLCFYLYPQEEKEINCFEILKVSKTELYNIDIWVNELISKNGHYSFVSDIQKLYVFKMYYYEEDENGKMRIYNKINKKTFLNHSFFYNIKHYRYNMNNPRVLLTERQLSDSSHLRVDCILYDSLDKYIGEIVYGLNCIDISAPIMKKVYTNLYNVIKENEIECVFEIYRIFSPTIYFGIKGNEIVAIYAKDTEFSIHSINELVNCCWDDIKSEWIRDEVFAE